MAICAAIPLLLCLLPAAAPPDPVFDLGAILALPMEAKVLASSEKEGIMTEEVLYRSEMDGPKPVDTFAYLSFPKDRRPMPAVIWAMPGLAPANTWWPQFFARRGYAALCVEYPMKGYRGTGQYAIAMDMEGDPRQSGLYHAAVAFLRGVSYLQARPEVDRQRIGIAGSSWGGFFTTLLVGIDPRLKVGASFFGSGNLAMGNNWWGAAGQSAKDEAFLQRWQATLDPATRLSHRKTPIGWFTGTNDVFFWMPSVMKTHALAAGPKHLALLPNWNHALSEALDNEVFAWIDMHLQGAPPLVAVGEVSLREQDGRVMAVWPFAGPRKVEAAELMLSYGDDGNWPSRCWKEVPAEIHGGECVAALPKSPLVYYVGGTVIDADGFRSSTPLLRIDPARHGLLDPRAPMDYDGAVMWGRFEDEQMVFLRRCSLSCPERSRDAKAGSYSAVISGGVNIRLPLLFTAAVPHRLTCALKAAGPVEVKLLLEGRFDGKPLKQEKVVRPGTSWTDVAMDVALPPAFRSDLSFSVTAPKDVRVLLDAVHFVPERK
jgi:dienelactone hydrolase